MPRAYFPSLALLRLTRPDRPWWAEVALWAALLVGSGSFMIGFFVLLRTYVSGDDEGAIAMDPSPKASRPAPRVETTAPRPGEHEGPADRRVAIVEGLMSLARALLERIGVATDRLAERVGADRLGAFLSLRAAVVRRLDAWEMVLLDATEAIRKVADDAREPVLDED